MCYRLRDMDDETPTERHETRSTEMTYRIEFMKRGEWKGYMGGLTKKEAQEEMRDLKARYVTARMVAES